MPMISPQSPRDRRHLACPAVGPELARGRDDGKNQQAKNLTQSRRKVGKAHRAVRRETGRLLTRICLTQSRKDAEHCRSTSIRPVTPVSKATPQLATRSTENAKNPVSISFCSLCSLWLKILCVSVPLRETLFALLLLSPVAASAAAADPLDSLIKRPLFQPDKTASVAAASVATPGRIEFGGFLVLAGKPEISLTDLTTGQAYFVGLRDTKAPFFIEALDQNTPTVTLRLNGQSVTLRLRQSTGDSAATTPPATTAPTQAIINDSGAPAEPVVTSEIKKTPVETPTQSGEPFRIPRQELRIPPRADDRK